jgi:hypothetical protein
MSWQYRLQGTVSPHWFTVLSVLIAAIFADTCHGLMFALGHLARFCDVRQQCGTFRRGTALMTCDRDASYRNIVCVGM